MLTEKKEEIITILPDGQLMVRADTIILRDGARVARSVHRHVCYPGEDMAGHSDQVRELAGIIHTPARIAAWKVSQSPPEWHIEA